MDPSPVMFVGSVLTVCMAVCIACEFAGVNTVLALFTVNGKLIGGEHAEHGVGVVIVLSASVREKPTHTQHNVSNNNFILD